jgi:hypothetical protein
VLRQQVLQRPGTNLPHLLIVTGGIEQRRHQVERGPATTVNPLPHGLPGGHCRCRLTSLQPEPVRSAAHGEPAVLPPPGHQISLRRFPTRHGHSLRPPVVTQPTRCPRGDAPI